MMETIEGLPDNVVGIVVKGRATRRDCDRVLAPAIQRCREWHYKLRLYFEIRSRYPGALWDDLDPGLAPAPLWERAAIVSDVAWVRYAVTALRLLIASEVRVFTLSQVPEALSWISAVSPSRVHAEAGMPRQSRRRAGSSPEGADGGKARPFVPAVQYLNMRS
jgi:hypothetical protein